MRDRRECGKVEIKGGQKERREEEKCERERKGR